MIDLIDQLRGDARRSYFVSLCVAVVLLAFSVAARAYIPMCESESMVLEQIVDGQRTTLTGSVLYYDTISDPNALILKTAIEWPLPYRFERFVIRYEYILQLDWDPHYACALFLKYDADGISRDDFEARS